MAQNLARVRGRTTNATKIKFIENGGNAVANLRVKLNVCGSNTVFVKKKISIKHLKVLNGQFMLFPVCPKKTLH